MTEPDFAKSLDTHLDYCRRVDAGKVAELWMRGRDSWWIARVTNLPEPYVCRLLAEMQDARRAARPTQLNHEGRR